jgi:hypothetical protein
MTDGRKLRSKLHPDTVGQTAEPSENEPRLITADYPAWMSHPFAAPAEEEAVRFRRGGIESPGPGGLAG